MLTETVHRRRCASSTTPYLTVRYRIRKMSSYQPSQSAQGSRRGSRNRGEGRGGRSSTRRPDTAKKAAPPTLWQKIKSIFGGPGRVASTLHPTPVAKSDIETPARSQKNAGSIRTIRKPESVEVTSPRLYVGNLSFDATESDLTELFKGVGQVVAVEVVSHRQTQRSKGFAFVQMQTTEEAKRAVEELHDKEFMNRKLVVSGAKNVDQQDGRSEPRFAA